jgi:hypothetical protein
LTTPLCIAKPQIEVQVLLQNIMLSTHNRQ